MQLATATVAGLGYTTADVAAPSGALKIGSPTPVQQPLASWITLVVSAVLPLAAAADTGASDPAAHTFLLDLPGDPVNVRYSPGSLDRATRVQERFDLVVQDFKSWSRGATALVVYLLSRDDWASAGHGAPYGLPEALGGRVLGLSAWGDDGTVRLWRELLGTRLPIHPSQPLYGTPEQAASLAVGDLMGVCEAARLLLAASGYSGDRPWVDGVLAHALALSTLRRNEPVRMPEVQQVFASLSSQGGGPGALSVGAAAAPASLRDRLWFEAQYFAAAGLLAEAEGRPPAKALLKWARKNGGRVRAADLLGRYPELDQWLRSSFRAE